MPTKTSDVPRVAVIGAGLGGIAVGVHLRRAGLHRFDIYERNDGPGGVWWTNDYPGCEVDVPSQVYTFSFHRTVFDRTYAAQPDLVRYVEDVIERFGLAGNIHYGTPVRQVAWDETNGNHVLTTGDGRTECYDVVVSCLGMLSNPAIPDWARDHVFGGELFHSAAYRHDLDLTGLRVAIVGTGATACQLAPAIADRVGELVVFQREPGYVLPKRVRDIPPDERRRLERSLLRYRLERYRLFHEANVAQGSFRIASRGQSEMQAFAESYIRKCVPDPVVADALTPTSPYGCKRPVFNSQFYPLFAKEHVRLVASGVRALDQTGIIDAEGRHHPCDVVILATGFEATDYLRGLDVRGRDGRSLHEVWQGEPRAFLGMTVPGFPDFFMLYGPNTNGGWSIISTLERQAEAVVRAVRRRARSGRGTETRPVVERAYNRWIQRRLARVADAYAAGCNNYYHAASGRNVTQMPLTALQYLLATRVLPLIGWRARRGRRSPQAARRVSARRG